MEWPSRSRRTGREPSEIGLPLQCTASIRNEQPLLRDGDTIDRFAILEADVVIQVLRADDDPVIARSGRIQHDRPRC